VGDLRKIFIDALVADSVEMTALGLPPGEVIQRSGFENEVPTKARPFAAYYLGAEVPAGSATKLRATRISLLVWVHDKPGDYFAMNEIMDRIRYVLENQDPADDFMELRWMERSQDLSDTDMGTICRWDRYEAQFTPRGAQS
jgi:hypothetical protein